MTGVLQPLEACLGQRALARTRHLSVADWARLLEQGMKGAVRPTGTELWRQADCLLQNGANHAVQGQQQQKLWEQWRLHAS